ncbi:MAG: hypothetical protein VR74_00655 [Hyphomonas sp. BRH_c22]|uniref:DUF192 domain-containing protein n=1 Tax=Hyphomonas sp. BRH_c22 TaxID=1629710 RepID=UPI0005F1E703|nr:DUF192 domain-containing protein [Hyphomonas sp. BRH_c22]KJS39733.1 MAG: hypothetical protein VR74_00655 [Hyphomonas sp. BRH_c22]
MTRLIASLFAAAFFLAQGAFAQLETGPLEIDTGDSVHKFTVELANDAEEIRTGLMDRESMAPNAGMLFDFGQPREASMWMKNTLIPLDMLFIAPDGKVLAIARNAVPGSLRTIGPGVPVKAVLELNGGRSEALGIEPGDMVRHEVLGNLGG